MPDTILQISSDTVGLVSSGLSFPVSFRDVSNYAASINDLNPLYYDSQHAVAHPLFPVSLSWQALQRKGNGWENGLSNEMKNRMVHYDEHLIINRLVKAGDVLKANSQLIGMEKHKLGTKIQVKISYHTEVGEEAVVEYVSSVLLGVTCNQDKVFEKSPVNIQNMKGDMPSLWEMPLSIDRTAPFLYDGCTGISARIHTDETYARSIGLPGIIYHGTASLARCVTALLNQERDGNPHRIRSISAKFIGKLSLPNTLTVKLIARDGNSLSFLAIDQNRQPILAGNLTLQ